MPFSRSISPQSTRRSQRLFSFFFSAFSHRGVGHRPYGPEAANSAVNYYDATPIGFRRDGCRLVVGCSISDLPSLWLFPLPFASRHTDARADLRSSSVQKHGPISSAARLPPCFSKTRRLNRPDRQPPGPPFR